MKLDTFVIYLAAGFFIAYGIVFMLAPVAMSGLVTGSAPEGVSALVDFRATYGGMTLAVGLAILYLHRATYTRASLVLVAMLLSCMALGRVIGLVVDGSGNVLMYVYLVLEIAGSALALLAMKGKGEPEAP